MTHQHVVVWHNTVWYNIKQYDTTTQCSMTQHTILWHNNTMQYDNNTKQCDTTQSSMTWQHKAVWHNKWTIQNTTTTTQSNVTQHKAVWHDNTKLYGTTNEQYKALWQQHKAACHSTKQCDVTIQSTMTTKQSSMTQHGNTERLGRGLHYPYPESNTLKSILIQELEVTLTNLIQQGL